MKAIRLLEISNEMGRVKQSDKLKQLIIEYYNNFNNLNNLNQNKINKSNSNIMTSIYDINTINNNNSDNLLLNPYILLKII